MCLRGCMQQVVIGLGNWGPHVVAMESTDSVATATHNAWCCAESGLCEVHGHDAAVQAPREILSDQEWVGGSPTRLAGRLTSIRHDCILHHALLLSFRDIRPISRLQEEVSHAGERGW